MDNTDPIIVQLGVRLAEVAAQNTASAVFGKIKALKSELDKGKVIVELKDLIHELLDEKQELELIAKSYEEELVIQKLKKRRFRFCCKTVLPAMKDFVGKASGNEEEFKNNIKSIEALEPLLSLDTLIVLQTLGVNYKKGIGEPLTNLTSQLINKVQGNNQTRLQELNLEREIEYFKLLQNTEACERLSMMNNNN